MKTFLKIKESSLTAEARIIKKIEKNKRTNLSLRRDLHLHRTNVVRPETRSTHLALGFLRGKPHHYMEQPLRPLAEGHIATLGFTKTHPNWDRIEQLVRKYGKSYFESDQVLAQKFSEWRDHALGIH